MLQSFVRNLVCQFVRPVFTSEEKITQTSSHHQTGTYYCRATKCYLFRSAQPLVGASNSRSASDEDFLKRIGGDEELCILDCRPRLNAFANQIGGKGTELKRFYPSSEVHFLDIDNIHVVRNSFNALEKVVMGNENEMTFGKSVEDTGWLLYVRRILAGSCLLLDEMHGKRRNVLVRGVRAREFQYRLLYL